MKSHKVDRNMHRISDTCCYNVWNNADDRIIEIISVVISTGTDGL